MAGPSYELIVAAVIPGVGAFVRWFPYPGLCFWMPVWTGL